MNLKKLFLPAILVFTGILLHAEKPTKSAVLKEAERVFDWQQQHPTGIDLWRWEYGTYYSGVMDLYKVDPKIKYLRSMMDMGRQYHWMIRPRLYDANVLAIAQMYLDLYTILKDPQMIAGTVYCLDASFERSLKEPDPSVSKNKYWRSWWSWSDALFMAPPAFAKYAKISGEMKYLDKMDDLWKVTYNYLYDKQDHLFYRDDRYFDKKSPAGEKIFWSRGNGWVMGGLVKILQAMPGDYKSRPLYENTFREMAAKLKDIQLPAGYWSGSLLDSTQFGGVETSGTAFFCYALAYGVNSGLLEKKIFIKPVLKAWKVLVESVHPDGKLGYVQQVGDSPKAVSYDDGQSYGAGAFMLAASEVYKLLDQ